MSEHYLTIGRLKEFIKDLPDDGKIYYQRIEDVYFEKHGWDKNVVKKPSEYPEYTDDFVGVFTYIKYRDDKDLYLTAHY